MSVIDDMAAKDKVEHQMLTVNHTDFTSVLHCEKLCNYLIRMLICFYLRIVEMMVAFVLENTNKCMNTNAQNRLIKHTSKQ